MDNTKQFELADLNKISVSHDMDTVTFLCSLTSEATRFPQGLSEEFGKLSIPVTVLLETVPRYLHHATDNPDEKLLRITVTRQDIPDTSPFSVFLSEHTLKQDLRITGIGQRGFHALSAAQEIVRLFRGYHHLGFE